jgi:hypothetical protein
MKNFMILISYLLRGGREIHTEFWWGNLKEREHLKELGIDGRKILKWTLKQ